MRLRERVAIVGGADSDNPLESNNGVRHPAAGSLPWAAATVMAAVVVLGLGLGLGATGYHSVSVAVERASIIPLLAGLLTAAIGVARMDHAARMPAGARGKVGSQRILSSLQLSVMKQDQLGAGLALVRVAQASAVTTLADERDELSKLIEARPDSSEEQEQENLQRLLEQVQLQLDAAQRLRAIAAQRLSESERQRNLAERLKRKASTEVKRGRPGQPRPAPPGATAATATFSKTVFPARLRAGDISQLTVQDFLDMADQELREESTTLTEIASELDKGRQRTSRPDLNNPWLVQIIGGLALWVVGALLTPLLGPATSGTLALAPHGGASSPAQNKTTPSRKDGGSPAGPTTLPSPAASQPSQNSPPAAGTSNVYPAATPHPDGGPSSRPSTFPPSASPSPSQAGPYSYTVNPKNRAPRPVPNLSLTAGDVVRITATSGQWECGTDPGQGWTGMNGNPNYTATNENWAVLSAPFCSLIGRIGNGPWQGIGAQPQFVADRSGSLALTTNDLMPQNCPQPPTDTSCYSDNRGAIIITITVQQ